MADILPPSFELRTAIIKKKSEQIGLIISNELIDYIAERLHNDIRQIEGLLKKISAFNSITGDVITKDMIEKAISHIDPGNITTDAMVEKILSAVSQKYSVSVSDMKSKKRMDFYRQSTIGILRVSMFAENIDSKGGNNNYQKEIPKTVDRIRSLFHRKI
jgi:chromosomal replication initiation ATPase DnaA